MRLDLHMTSNGYEIGWWDAEIGIEGDLCIGELVEVNKESSEEEQKECREHNFISYELKKIYPPDSVGKYSGVFYWGTRTTAVKALKAARALWKQYGEQKPWPEWAIKAASEGWKRPKGWKP